LATRSVAETNGHSGTYRRTLREAKQTVVAN
jgi:hypothetical protein